MSRFPVFVDQDNVRVEFGAAGGGFPTLVVLKEGNGTETVIIDNNHPQLLITLGDGRQVRPFIPDNCAISRCLIAGGAERLEFSKLLWTDASGSVMDKFQMSLRHEFWPDGTAFTSAFFMVEDNNGPDIKGFELSMPVKTAAFDDVRWGFFPRPTSEVDSSFIQTIATARFIESGTNRSFDGQIVPDVNFNCYRKKAPGVYLEFFMEGQNSLSGKPNDNSSSVVWNGQDSVNLNWNFQKDVCHSKQRPWQWQNQWGWIITNAPTARRFPPLKMYHYLDNYQRYPDQRQMEKIVAADTDVLVTHENWRLDPQNGSVPYDADQFARVVKQADEHDIRVAVYIRGDELSASEESCDWFDSLLKKGKDGLYMDFGGPIHEALPPNERFQGGRIAFRKHFLKIRRYRERVGEDGIFMSHTGPFFSALGMTSGNIDGYVSGEGERGMLIKGRMEHEYFSEAFVCCGSMWTAAFPEYGTAKMAPFMAATGQFPHNPLGSQFKSSSLSHHGEPGINDTYLRPLWKLWGLFRHERDLTIFNDYNCYGVLSHTDNQTGGYLMITRSKKSALLILTNFSEQPCIVRTAVDWGQTGFDIANAQTWLCRPVQATPGTPTVYHYKTAFSTEIEGLGVVGWLLTLEPEQVKESLATYAKPYPKLDTADLEHLRVVDRQKHLRNEPQPAGKQYLQVQVPALSIPYEDSMYWDLYENSLELGTFDAAGNFNRIGWICKGGFVQTEPSKEQFVWPNQVSAWMPLHELLPDGTHNVGIRSMHQGTPFYSFITATLSPEANAENPGAYTLEFMNEIESDRAFIKWKIYLKH